jgi:hypothetical protein
LNFELLFKIRFIEDRDRKGEKEIKRCGGRLLEIWKFWG